jgi:hypothetical protein
MNMNQGFGAPQMSVGQMQNGNGIAPNLSGTDLSSVFGGEVQSSGGLMVQFFYHRVRIGGKNTGTGKYETRLAVALKPRGDMLTLAVRPITEEDAQRQFPAEWQQFKMYMDTPTRGTPLHELPGATQSMIAILVLGGIRSIEDLVGLPSDVCAQMGMDAVHAQTLAKTWIQRKNGAAAGINMAERLAKPACAPRTPPRTRHWNSCAAWAWFPVQQLPRPRVGPRTSCRRCPWASPASWRRATAMMTGTTGKATGPICSRQRR